MSRPWTPSVFWEDEDGRRHGRIAVKRCCNGCGREIGDPTEAEMCAAVDGAPLPDVRVECGCVAAEQVAL